MIYAGAADSEGARIFTSEFWSDVVQWLEGAGLTTLRVAGILLGALIVAWIARGVIRRVVNRIVHGAKSRANVDDTQALNRSPLAAVRLVQRTRTLGSILQNLLNIVLVIVTLILVVNTINPGILGSFALLTAALGAGLGFGAQNIVKDVLNGIFIVAEDQVGIGDVVDLGLATGTVEFVSVRITHVRSVDGTLWYVRNGEILRIGNMSQGWARAVIDFPVPPDSDIDRVEGAMLDTAKAMARDPEWRPRIIEQPEIWGLESVSGDALVIRLVMKVRPSTQWEVTRELNRRLKKTMDELAMHLPHANPVVITGPPATATPEDPVWRPRKTSADETGEPDAGAPETRAARPKPEKDEQ